MKIATKQFAAAPILFFVLSQVKYALAAFTYSLILILDKSPPSQRGKRLKLCW
jgi:hypothetical protein